MLTPQRTLAEYVALAKAMSAEAFAARFACPFLFGREVLEDEFRFQTQVTSEASRSGVSGLSEHPGLLDLSGISKEREDGGDVFASAETSRTVLHIRHWVIPVQKPEGAPAQDRVFLGRGETNDICVPHNTVSKLHAYFLRDSQIVNRWLLVDAGSANGTKSNGMRLLPRARAPLVDGDTLVFGRCVFQWLTARSLHLRLQSLVSPAS